MTLSDKVCIIGAGPSGITACKILQEGGITFDCFEAGSDIGGIWRYNNDNGMSAAYKSLHINSSKKLTQYTDFPMPEDYPDFPHHEQVYAYLRSYADHFGIRQQITFNTSVEKVTPTEGGKYLVTLSNGEERAYNYVIVANGHHWKPRWPEPPFPGEYSGEILHSIAYRTPDIFQNKDVLVVGIGNSAVDIACDAARQYSGKVVISTRNSAYIIPHYFLGKPFGELSRNSPSILPLWVKRILLKAVLWLARGNQENYGIPRPNHKILSSHHTVSQDIFALAGRKRILFKPDIASFSGKKVQFTDGTSDAFDLIVYCTGYKISFPFLDNRIIDVKTIEDSNNLLLYRRIVLPDHPNLFFLGFVQPSISILPVVEAQSKWIAAVIKREISLPGKEEMRQEIVREQEKISRRYKSSARHTIQVESGDYIRLLNKDI